jgi:hypothetical protein
MSKKKKSVAIAGTMSAVAEVLALRGNFTVSPSEPV